MGMKCAILGLAMCLVLLSFYEVSCQVERSIAKLDRSTDHRNFQAIKRKSESESSWEKNTTSTDKKKISVSLLEENLKDSFQVNNTIQYEATSAHDEVGENSSMMDEINREIEAHLSGLNKQAGSVAFGESSDAADFDVERRTQLEEIEQQIKAAAATRTGAEEGITKSKSQKGTHEIKSEAGNELETTRKTHKTKSEYKAASTESGQKCSTCGGLKKGSGGSWMLGSLGIAQSGVWRCFDQGKNGIKVEEDASIVIPKYDIDTIIKEESASQDSASKTSSLIASLTQIVEKHRKELWSSSVNIGKSKETSETVEKLKVTLKQYRGISDLYPKFRRQASHELHLEIDVSHKRPTEHVEEVLCNWAHTSVQEPEVRNQESQELHPKHSSSHMDEEEHTRKCVCNLSQSHLEVKENVKEEKTTSGHSDQGNTVYVEACNNKKTAGKVITYVDQMRSMQPKEIVAISESDSSARELVTRSDFEEILETAARYEELSSASVSYISKLSMYRSVIKEGLKSSQRVELAQARAKLLKDMADEKQRNVDDQFALVKDLAQRGDTLYVKIFAIKKLVAKLEAEKEEVDLSFEEIVRSLSRVIGEASEAYEEYHVVVRKWKEEQAAAEFSREAIENAEVVWVQFLSTL
ncbi:unnamed protein product [Eruca vesicaria subsp. sativa]|uniref:Uncharacterized protein n=1 Tax=Eruca vesicaria subsp. sativa TaxID=29727 RepID=A0ABC8KZZ6_ERUVS|nr:unnamed protein product [Eruca vesicaria subsp. sativa]